MNSFRHLVKWDVYTGRFETTERVELRVWVSDYLQESHFHDGQEAP